MCDLIIIIIISIQQWACFTAKNIAICKWGQFEQ